MITDMVNNLDAAGFDRAAIEARIEADNTILGSIRSCIRAPLGRGYLRMTGNGLRHGTGNECEDRWLRFYQKGGDGEVDSNPVAMLSKGEVYQLAVGLGQRLNASEAYRSIIDAAPTPELWGTSISHTDEDEIGAYLGLPDSGHTFYSYVNAQDGSYRTVGLIERVARFADTPAGGDLFTDTLDEQGMNSLIARAQRAPAFAAVAPDTAATMLRAAHRAERVTRHKENPNCPSLGQRAELLSLGILTDTLPSL
jgi:NH3-dependent NAD+ synthetase